MSRVREIWERGAGGYDEIYANNVPYHRSHAVVVDLLPKKESISVLDLGAGTGLLAERILDRLPQSSVTCLDFSSSMIEQCQRKLARFGARAKLVCADLMTWRNPEPYDAVVTCNALVYKDIDLAECYRKYAAALRAPGMLVNATVVKSDDLSSLMEVMENLHDPDAPPPSEEVLQFASTAGREIAHFGEGSLAFAETVETHLEMLAEAGLSAYCPWHYLAQAVMLGRKERV